MRQSVSAPVAVIVLLLVAAVTVLVASRREPPPPPEDEVFVLPPEPPVEDAEVLALRRGTAPLGVFVVMPPLGGDRFRGSRVAMVVPGSPGAKGGIEPGDLILRFNGKETPHPYALVAAIAAVNPDTVNEVVVERAGEERTLSITGVNPSPPDKG